MINKTSTVKAYENVGDVQFENFNLRGNFSPEMWDGEIFAYADKHVGWDFWFLFIARYFQRLVDRRRRSWMSRFRTYWILTETGRYFNYYLSANWAHLIESFRREFESFWS